MLYIHHQLSSTTDDTDTLHNAGDSMVSASSCFTLLNTFATQIATPELEANERMQIWDTLLQDLKNL